MDQSRAAADEARARLNRAERQVELTKNSLSYATLLADSRGVVTATLKDGHMDNGPGEPGTTYAVEGDRITFDVPAWGYSLTFTFSVDGKGNLHLTPAPSVEKGDALECSYKPWTKIG